MNLNLFFILSIILFGACSFKPEEQSKKSSRAKTYEEINPKDLSKIDTDGDRLNDLQEKEQGWSSPKFSNTFLSGRYCLFIHLRA
jgi:hypothetical protein